MRTHTGSIDAAKARAEAFFRTPAAMDASADTIRTAEDAVRDRTAKLREARLAKEALEATPARTAKPAKATPRRRTF